MASAHVQHEAAKQQHVLQSTSHHLLQPQHQQHSPQWDGAHQQHQLHHSHAEFSSPLPDGDAANEDSNASNTTQFATPHVLGSGVDFHNGTEDVAAGLDDNEVMVVVQRVPAPAAGPVAAPRPKPIVPPLNFSMLRTSNSAVFTKNKSEAECSVPGPLDEQLCFEAATNCPIHKDAPFVDNRCYVYKPVSQKEVADIRQLLGRLPQAESAAVSRMWDALLLARHDCEAMAARGVRVARDVSRDWQETVSDLIDRVVAQDNEINGLKQQMKQAPQAAGCIEELHAQVVRLKRQRDKLSRENQDVSLMLHDTQELLNAAKDEARRHQEAAHQAHSRMRLLSEQHSTLLRQHIDVASYAEHLQAELTQLRSSYVLHATADKDSHSSGAFAQVHSRRNSPRGVGTRSPRGVAMGGSPSPIGTSKLAYIVRERGDGAGSARGSVDAGPYEMRAPRHHQDLTLLDSREVDQFDQEVPLGSPNAHLVHGKQQRWRPGEPPADLRADIDACRQQLELLASIGV